MATAGSGGQPRKRAATRKAAKDDIPLPEAGTPTTRQLYDALTESTKGVTELVSVLKETEKSNKDTAEWRGKATRANRITQAVLAIAIVGGIVFQIRDSDREQRDKARQEQQDTHDAQVAEAQRIEACRGRNASQRYSREVASNLVDGVQEVGGEDLPIIGVLRTKVATAPPDSDCDRDSRLTTADYPPIDVPQ